MFKLKKVIGETDSVLSWNYVDYILSMPEMYVCSTIADFIKNQPELKETGFRLFSPGRHFKHFSVIYFSSAYYQERDAPSLPPEERKNILGDMVSKYKMLTQNKIIQYQSAAKELQKIQQYASERLAVADLYDLSGVSLPIHATLENVPPGRLYDLWIKYEPRTTLCRLLYYNTHIDPMPDNKSK